MIYVLNALIIITSAIIVLSLLSFRRQNRRYKRRISLLAWLLLNIAIMQAIFAISHGYHHPMPALLMLLINASICITLLRHKGNVAYLIPERLCRA